MKRIALVMMLCGIFGLSVFAGSVSPLLKSGNYLVNPGWEGGTGPWYILAPFKGTMERMQKGRTGGYALQLTALEKDGQHRVFLRQMCPRLDVFGKYCRFSFWARGRGRVYSQMHLICAGPGERGYFRSIDSPYVKLTDQWQKIEHVFHIEETSVNQFGVVIGLVDAGAVCLLDDASLTIESQQDEIRPLFRHVVAVRGKVQNVVFRKQNAGGKIFAFDGKQNVPVSLGENGKYTVKCVPDAHVAGLYDKNSPAGAQVLIDYMEPEDFQKMDRLARKVKLDRKISMLFLGDSLMDQYRGKNYIDKFAFWLGRYNPGKVEYRNAGVSGDYASSMLKRLNKVPYIFNLFRYENLHAKKYDFIFISIGGNDCRLTWYPKVRCYEPAFSARRIAADYRKVIAFLKEKHPEAHIVLVTPMAEDVEASKKASAAAMKANRSHAIFGDPDRLAKYCDMMKEIAAENHLTMIDVRTSSAGHPDKKSFYRTDGIHLKQKGQDFMARELLGAWVEKIQK